MCGVCGCGQAALDGTHAHVGSDGRVFFHAHQQEQDAAAHSAAKRAVEHHVEEHHAGEHSAEPHHAGEHHAGEHHAEGNHSEGNHSEGNHAGEHHPHEHSAGQRAAALHRHLGPDEEGARHGAAPAHDDAGLVRMDSGPAGTEVAGLSQGRLLRIQQDILGKNDELARVNRARFAHAGSFVVNLMSSPGAGKTTLLVRTLRELAGVPAAVIEGDQQTSLDADRIRATGAPAVQVNTGKGCHLDAQMVGRALDRLPPPQGVLFIENVGNLVCPAGFDLGESKRVVVVSVTEGEDKPLKYPDIFAAADLVLVNKADLLPHLTFDVAALERNVRRINPVVALLRLSAATGEGFGPWLQWLRSGAAAAKEGKWA